MLRFSLLILIALLSTLSAGTSSVFAHDHDPPRIMVAQVKQMMDQGSEVVFLDTRTDLSKATIKAKIPGAIQIKNGDILNKVLLETPKESLIVIYCT